MIESALEAQSTEALIARVLAMSDAKYDEYDSDEEWRQSKGQQIISTLHKRSTREVFEAAKALCFNPDPIARETGADILGELGWDQDFPFRDEVLPILVHLIETDQDVGILESACIGFGFMHEPRAIDAVLTLKNHPNERVRLAVVRGLWTLEDPRAINGLIELSRDPESKIRDWATFGLGSQIELNTPEIRQALYDRLTDADAEIRAEAIIGLARRKDSRLVPLLISALSEMPHGDYIIEAAQDLAEARLLPALLRLRTQGPDNDGWYYGSLIWAIRVCWGEALFEDAGR